MGRTVPSLVLSFAAAALAAPAAAQPAEHQAVITSRTDTGLNARTLEGPVRILLTPDTEVRERDGLRRRARDPDSLIPGLVVRVRGEQDGNRITAERIDYEQRDRRAALARRPGTAGPPATPGRAVIEGRDYEIRQEAIVLFATGRADIAPNYRDRLRQLARAAPGFGDYRISVLGFTDATGDPAANARLGLRRAEAVGAWLRQSGLIEPDRLLPPSAGSQDASAQGEAAPASDGQARRVVVRVVTPKGQLTQ